MARQARSAATRSKIIAAAVDVFDEFGYPATTFGTIIDRVQMTKGALYYHFDSKEALAAAIMEQTHDSFLTALHNITESSAPALENLIHGQFVIADFVTSDKAARIGMQLLRTFAGVDATAERIFAGWLDTLVELVDRAATEGDLRSDLVATDTAELLLEAMLGAEMLAGAAADLRTRLERMWSLLLPTVVSAESVDYFREFLARESLRQAR